MPMTDHEIFEQIRPIIVEALGVDLEQVTLDARLTDDLAAESIDYLDIFFRLEQRFGIKIEAGDKLIRTLTEDERLVLDGTITDEGLEELRRRLPGVSLAPLEQSRDIRDFLSIFTGEALVRMVQTRLAEDHGLTDATA